MINPLADVHAIYRYQFSWDFIVDEIFEKLLPVKMYDSILVKMTRY